MHNSKKPKLISDSVKSLIINAIVTWFFSTTTILGAVYFTPIFKSEYNNTFLMASELEKVFIVSRTKIKEKKLYHLVYKDNAELKGNNTNKGIELESIHKSWLDIFADALQACNNNQEVEIKVVGFASSAEFYGVPAHVSEEKNLLVSNYRAKAVEEYLNSKYEIKINLVEWSDYKLMEGNRPIDDINNNSGIKDQELLNRMVQIEVLNFGSCSRATINQKFRTAKNVEYKDLMFHTN